MRASVKRKKEEARQRRKTRIRKRITGSDGVPRISIYRSARYTYLQAISDESAKTIVSVSSRDPQVAALAKELESDREGAPRSTKSVAAARAVGTIPLMPGGLLVVEAVLVPGLVSSGMGLPNAISAMLVTSGESLARIGTLELVLRRTG